MKSECFCGDASELLKGVGDETIDLTVTSPPYDELRTYNGYAFDYREILRQLYRVTKAGGVVVWVVADQTRNGSESGTSFKQALYAMECGFNLHDTMIWLKDTCAFPETSRYYQCMEYMFVFSKGKPKTVNLIADKKNKWSGTNIHGTYRTAEGNTKKRDAVWKESVTQDYGVRTNVWEIPTEKANKTGHPAVFPEKLVADHLRTWSQEGDTVLDPFLGSGTTRIVAYDMKRDFIGFEISEEYFEKQEQRFKRHSAQMNLFVDEI